MISITHYYINYDHIFRHVIASSEKWFPCANRFPPPGGGLVQEGGVAVVLTQLLLCECVPTLLRAVSSVVLVSNRTSYLVPGTRVSRHLHTCRHDENGWVLGFFGFFSRFCWVFFFLGVGITFRNALRTC